MDQNLKPHLSLKDANIDNAIEEHGVIAIYEKVEQPSIFSVHL